eukprot:tig00021238_g19545.t1
MPQRASAPARSVKRNASSSNAASPVQRLFRSFQNAVPLLRASSAGDRPIVTEPAPAPAAPRRGRRGGGGGGGGGGNRHHRSPVLSLSDAAFFQHIDNTGKDYLVVGTSAYSKRSAEDAKHVIRDAHPDAVVIDMDPQVAYARLDPKHGAAAERISASLPFAYVAVARRGVAGLLETYYASSSFAMQRATGVAPDGDLLDAAREAAARGVPVVFGGRDASVALDSDPGFSSAVRRLTLGFCVLAAGVLAAAMPPGSVAGFLPPWARPGGARVNEAPDGHRPNLKLLGAAGGEDGAGPKERLAREALAIERGGLTGEAARDEERHLAWAAAAHPRLPPSARRVVIVARRPAPGPAPAPAPGPGALLTGRQGRGVGAGVGAAAGIDGAALEAPPKASRRLVEKRHEEVERGQEAAANALRAAVSAPA